MASVLIKGMEMPSKCEECQFCGSGYCSLVKRYFPRSGEKPPWCPLIDGEIYENALAAEILRWGEVYDSKGNRYSYVSTRS